MGHIFVSYAREDGELASRLTERIEAYGFETWIDHQSLGPREFDKVITDALNAADAVVVIWSQASIGSHWVRDEASVGRDRGVLVPVSFDGSSPPLGFRQLNVLALSDGIPASDIGLLLSRISELTGSHDEHHRTAGQRHAPTKVRRFLPAGISISIVLGGYLLSGASLFETEQIPLRTTEMPLTASPSDSDRSRETASRLTIATELQPQVKESLRRIGDTVLSNGYDGGPWMVGQQLVALTGVPHVKVQWTAASLLSQMDDSCGCWHKALLKYSTGPHNAATMWALLGLSRLKQRPPLKTVDYVLNTQSKSGAWGVVPARIEQSGRPVFEAPDDSVASAYVTAFAILALSDLLANGLIDERQTNASADAMDRAAEWLFRKREVGRAAWKDFPNHKYAVDSFAISGLALHALSVARATRPHLASSLLTLDVMAGLSRSWLEGLPRELPSLQANELKSEIFVNWPRQDAVNDVFQSSTPWLLVASVDAFAFAPADVRRELILWLDRAVASLPLDPESVQRVDAWHASEAIVGLRYVLGESVI